MPLTDDEDLMGLSSVIRSCDLLNEVGCVRPTPKEILVLERRSLCQQNAASCMMVSKLEDGFIFR